jgi:long-chain fatty acid transport protein
MEEIGMKLRSLVGALALAGLAMPAFATDGYFSHGYGMIAKGMGGAATAMAEDSMGGANNPASMVWVGDRLDVGIDWFSPIRNAKREGGGVPFDEKSDNNNFFIPEFGYNKLLNPDMSLGVSVYGNGGMNTTFNKSNVNCGGGPVNNPLCGSGNLGVNLEQLIIAPTFAYKLNPNHSIGVAPLIGYQRFGAAGLQGFAPLSNDPANLTNNGYDDAWGWGVRLGWQGHITSTVTLGAAYSSKIYMSKFDKYKGLFANEGEFDIPENFNLGLAWKATPDVTVALDYQRINYDGIPSISNSGTNLACAMRMTPTDPGCLGGSNGLGFAWKSIDVWKLGVEYHYSNALTLRAGYNHSDNPIPSDQTTFNILAPGVIEDHLTLGMSYAVTPTSQVTVAYMHAFEKSVTGPTNPNFPVGGTETIKMYQNSLGVAYGVKF